MSGERQTELHQAEGVIYDCPHAEVCKTCPCSHEDDACFPGERLRAEVARLRAERDKLRSHVKQEQGLSNAMHLEIVAAEARVAELEGNLEAERAQAAVEIEQLRQAQNRVAELETERDRAQIEVERLGKVLDQNEEWREGYAYGISKAGVDRAVMERTAEMLMWLRREDPSALKGYWPALHALEAEFSVPTRTREACDGD